MGLPSSGKTTLANQLTKDLKKLNSKVTWFNADLMRQRFNDWDFSIDGRIRQATRMSRAADEIGTGIVICDFVCPLEKMREAFGADYTVWIDTVRSSGYADTNKLFEVPTDYDMLVTTKNSEIWSGIIVDNLLSVGWIKGSRTPKATPELPQSYQE